MASLQLPPLASALAVLHRAPSSDGQIQQQLSVREQVTQLPHVVATVSGFLDYGVPQFWTLLRASACNLLSLLARLAAHEPADMDPHYRAFNCSKMLVSAVANNNLVMVQWLHDAYCPGVHPRKAMIKAAELGRVSILKWLVLRHVGTTPIPAEIGAIAAYGNVETLAWLDPYLRSSGKLVAVESSVQGGHFEAVKYLHERYFCQPATRRSHRATDYAICGGHLEILKYLHAKRYSLNVLTGKLMAAQRGSLDIVEWLFPMMSSSRDQTLEIDAAAGAGHLEVVQWLQANGSRGFTANAMVGAARHGHLEVLKWLHVQEERYTCDARAMDLSAQGGHFAVVKWLHEHRTEGCTTAAMDTAAAGGHLEIVQWLHETRSEGCTYCAMDTAA